ncbi:TPA: hypothetical protein ACN8NA_004470, partial [Escherichia coli]
ILSLEKLLEQNGISLSSNELLEKYGKFCYQTVKKFLSVMHIPERYSVIVDSESMLIKPTELTSLVHSFVENPFLLYSKVSERRRTSPFLLDVVNNSAVILGTTPDEYFLEHFVWVYDKDIVNEMFYHIGDIISVLEKVKAAGGRNLFEIQTYLAYIYMNNERFNYRLVNVIDEVSKIDIGYLDKYYDVFKGNFGVLEMAGSLVSNNNYKEIASLLCSLNVTMVRSEYYGRMKYHNKFIKAVNPSFLCSSQAHSFGLNDTRINRLLDATDTRWEYNIIVEQLHVLNIIRLCSLLYRTFRVLIKTPINYLLNVFR